MPTARDVGATFGAREVPQGLRQPDTLLAWDDYTVHKAVTCKEAEMSPCSSPLGGLTPKVQPCDGHANKLIRSNMTVYDHNMHDFLRYQSSATTAAPRSLPPG